jgi:hypothetical protein
MAELQKSWPRGGRNVGTAREPKGSPPSIIGEIAQLDALQSGLLMPTSQGPPSIPLRRRAHGHPPLRLLGSELSLTPVSSAQTHHSRPRSRTLAPQPFYRRARSRRAKPALPSGAGVTGPRYQARRENPRMGRFYRARITSEMARWD